MQSMYSIELYFVYTTIPEDWLLLSQTVSRGLFLVSSNKVRQLIFFLNNKVWFLQRWCPFHPCLTKIYSMCSNQMWLRFWFVDSKLPAVAYGHNISISDHNIKELNVYKRANHIANGRLHKKTLEAEQHFCFRQVKIIIINLHELVILYLILLITFHLHSREFVWYVTDIFFKQNYKSKEA